MKTIICDFKRSSLGVIGEENEHNAIELLFNLPKDFEEADYIHVEFDTMDGDPFARDTFEFNKEEMTLRGRLDQKVMKAGELKIQLVGYAIDEEGTIDEIAKSPVIKAIVSNSVNGIIKEGDENPSMIELLKAKLDKLLEEGINVEGGGALPVAYINDKGELCFELGSGITDAYINQQGELEIKIETEEGEKPLILGKVKGRTPEFRLTEKILEIKYDDETSWAALVDFSTIASSFDLRLNQETYFLEAQREVDGEWEPMVDLSALKLAHEHSNKGILDKITSSIFEQIKDAISKRHKHENIDTLNQITDEHIENIDKIPEIEELVNNPTKQLVEGILYTDEVNKGLSANKNAVPTADSVWIVGEASSSWLLDEIMTSATLNVATSGTSKSSTTTVTIEIVFTNFDSIYFLNLTKMCKWYIGLIFKDSPDKTYYINVSSVMASNTGVSIKFTFIDGQDTFPITGNITRAIQSIIMYPKTGRASSAEGLGTIAASDYSHVQGKYNIVDTEGKYAHIVGNGEKDTRSNAHTLDWEGNAWYAGSIKAPEVFAFDADNITRETVSSNLWNGSFVYLDPDLLQEGTQYIITMKGKEHRFTGTNLTSFTLGDYSVNMWYAEDYWGEGIDTYQGSITPRPDYNEVMTLEKEVGSYVDLLSHIKSVKEDIVPYIKESKEFFESPSLETLEIGVWDNEGASRETMLSGTISGILNWYNLFELKVGAFYAVTIDGVESIVRCSSPNGLNAEVGDISFFITRAWFDEEHEMFVFDAGSIDSTIVRTITIEKINLPRVDLMQYINALEDRIKALEDAQTVAETE